MSGWFTALRAVPLRLSSTYAFPWARSALFSLPWPEFMKNKCSAIGRWDKPEGKNLHLGLLFSILLLLTDVEV